MKEQKLIEIKNKVETLAKVTNKLIQEINNIKQLALGTLETIKKMPDYEDAIKELRAKATEESSKTKEVKSLETPSD